MAGLFGNASFAAGRPLLFLVPQGSWNPHQQKAQRSVITIGLQAAKHRMPSASIETSAYGECSLCLSTRCFRFCFCHTLTELGLKRKGSVHITRWLSATSWSHLDSFPAIQPCMSHRI